MERGPKDGAQPIIVIDKVTQDGEPNDYSWAKDFPSTVEWNFGKLETGEKIIIDKVTLFEE